MNKFELINLKSEKIHFHFQHGKMAYIRKLNI